MKLKYFLAMVFLNKTLNFYSVECSPARIQTHTRGVCDASRLALACLTHYWSVQNTSILASDFLKLYKTVSISVYRRQSYSKDSTFISVLSEVGVIHMISLVLYLKEFF